MKFLKSLFGCVLLLGVMTTFTPTASAQSITSVPISSSDGVYLVKTVMPTPDFEFTMNNLLLVHPDSVILVDNLPPGLYPFFAFEIHTLSAGEPVDILINTSWHFDHVGLNAEFNVFDGTSTIIAHSRAGDYMNELNCIEEIGICMPPLPEEAQPTEGIRGVVKLLSGGETITLKTIENSHSGADLVIYLEEANVVHTGDIYFGGMYPIIDLAGGGTVNGMLHALNQVLASIDEDTIVVPSHGVVGNRQSVVEFSDMLRNTRKLVRKLIAEGLTEMQVMFHPSFAALDAQWGSGFIPGPVFRLIVYRDLASHRGGQM
ncbi:MAG: MBL fold metallo-hydrolase [Desulfofustis sp.]|nr:MBL fold metallo-hydrolase [Desulfofustis sp.]